MTAQYNFIGSESCFQNASFQAKLTWNDANSNPYNLSSYGAFMQVRPYYQNPVSIIDLVSYSSDPGYGSRLMLDNIGGITIYISKDDTVNLVSGIYDYDLVLVNPDGFATRLLEGKFEVRIGVTRNIPASSDVIVA